MLHITQQCTENKEEETGESCSFQHQRNTLLLIISWSSLRAPSAVPAQNTEQKGTVSSSSTLKDMCNCVHISNTHIKPIPFPCFHDQQLCTLHCLVTSLLISQLLLKNAQEACHGQGKIQFWYEPKISSFLDDASSQIGLETSWHIFAKFP